MRKNRNFWGIVMLFLLFWLLMPIFIEYGGINIPEHKGGWLDFWAQHLSFISAGVVSYFVIQYQSRKDEKMFVAQQTAQKKHFLFEQKFQRVNSMVSGVNRSFFQMASLCQSLVEIKKYDNDRNIDSECQQILSILREIVDVNNDLKMFIIIETTYKEQLKISSEIIDRYEAMGLSIDKQKEFLKSVNNHVEEQKVKSIKEIEENDIVSMETCQVDLSHKINEILTLMEIQI